MADWVPSFVITELTGEQRQLRLAGRALPYQSYELEGSMRAEVTWYPGNPVATIQMLGAQEAPTTIKGMWKDRFIESLTATGQPVTPSGVALWKGEQVADTRSLVAAVEQLRLSGQLLLVAWGETQRSGVLTRFKQTWPRYEECEWEMEFTWVSRGEAPQPVSAPPSTQAPQAFADEVAAFVEESLALAKTPPVPIVAEIADAIIANLDAMTAQLEEIQSAVQGAVDLVLTPVQVAQRTLGAINRLKTASAELVNVCSGIPAQFVEEGGEALTDFGEAIRTDQFLRDIQTNARRTQLASAEQEEAIRASALATQLTDVFIATQDMDLRNVSVQYYGTQDQWLYLKTYNGFVTSRLEAGQVVLVPVLRYNEEA